MQDRQESENAAIVLMDRGLASPSFAFVVTGEITKPPSPSSEAVEIVWSGRVRRGKMTEPLELTCSHGTDGFDDLRDPVRRCIKLRRAVVGTIQADNRGGLVAQVKQTSPTKGAIGELLELTTESPLWREVFSAIPGDVVEFVVAPVGYHELLRFRPAKIVLRARKGNSNLAVRNQIRPAAKAVGKESRNNRAASALFAGLLDGSIDAALGVPSPDLVETRLECFRDELRDLTCIRYQPIAELAPTAQGISVPFCEALIRHAGQDPAEYAAWAVPSARLWGDPFVRALDEWVTKSVIAHLDQNRGCAASVNVHWSTVKDGGFASMVSREMTGRQCDPSRLILELSEVGVPETLDDAIHGDLVGFRFAIDDYPNEGASPKTVVGLGSRFTLLKIDRWVFDQEATLGQQMLQDSVRIARSARGACAIVQEWVYNEERLQMVAREGIRYVQFRQFEDSAPTEWETPRRTLDHGLRTRLARAYERATLPPGQRQRREERLG